MHDQRGEYDGIVEKKNLQKRVVKIPGVAYNKVKKEVNS